MSRPHPPKNAIFSCKNFDYVYVGPYHDPCRTRTIVECGSGIVSEYDPSAENYLYCRAVFLHNGRYYYIPSSFSDIGTLSETRDWKIVCNALDYQIETLDVKTCKKVCPGYLD